MEFYIHESTFYCNEYNERQKRHTKIHFVTMIQMSLDVHKTATVLKLLTVYTHYRYVTVTAIHCNMYMTWKYVKIKSETRDDSVYSSVADDSHESDASVQSWSQSTRAFEVQLLFSLICKFWLPFRWPLHYFLDKI